jgi:rRNA-processing protein EBP2
MCLFFKIKNQLFIYLLFIKETLKNKLKDIYLNMDWIERMDVTVSVEKEDLIDSNKTIDLVDNDFKRESLFLRQAEAAIKIALPRFKSLNIPVKQPKDYFAQMVKSAKHMEKVQEVILSKQAEIEKREKVKKLRELKKMGKQIQMEAEKKKQMAKKKLNESIKKFKKGDKDSLEIALEDDEKPKKRKSSDAGENGDKRMKKMDNNGHAK